MRKVFGILFVVLAVVCFPSILAPTVAGTIGRFIGWLLISVVPAYFLLREKKKKDTNDEEEKTTNKTASEN